MTATWAVALLVPVAMGGGAAWPRSGNAPAASPWRVEDRLGPGFLPGPGVRVAASGVSREAVAGELETRLRVAWGSAAGPGGALERRRVWTALGPGGTRDEAALFWRRPLWRATFGVRRWTWGRRARVSIPLGAHRRLAESLLAGVGVELFPGEPPDANRFIASLSGVAVPFSGRLRVGPEPGAWGAAFGLGTGSRVDWSVSYADGAPGFEAVWDLGRVELRARTSAHPDLGAVQNVTVVFGGGRR